MRYPKKRRNLDSVQGSSYQVLNRTSPTVWQRRLPKLAFFTKSAKCKSICPNSGNPNKCLLGESHSKQARISSTGPTYYHINRGDIFEHHSIFAQGNECIPRSDETETQQKQLEKQLKSHPPPNTRNWGRPHLWHPMRAAMPALAAAGSSPPYAAPSSQTMMMKAHLHLLTNFTIYISSIFLHLHSHLPLHLFETITITRPIYRVQ